MVTVPMVISLTVNTSRRLMYDTLSTEAEIQPPGLHSTLLCPSNIQKELSTTTLLSAARQIRNIGVLRQRRRNLPTRLNLSDLNQAVSRLGNGLSNGIGTLGLTLSPDDVGLSLLLCLFDHEPRPLRVLLCDLLLLDRLGELPPERHVRDGYVLEGNVELGRAAREVLADSVGDDFTLRDELGGVELRYDCLEDFVADGREDSLIVILAE